MKLKLLLFYFLIFFSINSYTQNINTNPYWQGEITFNDGSIIKGFVQVPNNPAQVIVSFKTTINGNNEKFKKKDIKLVRVVSKSGKFYEFEPVAVVTTLKGNTSIGKSLLLVSNKNDFAKFYVSYGVYKVDKNGELYFLYRYIYGNDFPSITYVIKKRDFEKAQLLHMTNLLRGFKKSANHFLTEDPKLLEKINNGDLDFKDMDEIIETYLESTKNL